MTPRNVQIAAACALMLAGVSFSKAIRIAGMSIRQAHRALPPDWHRGSRSHRWRKDARCNMTPERAEILRLRAQALSHREIAQRVGVSPATVSRVVAHITPPNERNT